MKLPLQLRLATPAPILLLGALLLPPSAWTQEAATRAESINTQRTNKQARIWPERTSGFVTQLNKLTERGLLEGGESGKGLNGVQLVLGGMRSGNGTSVGVGYRRIDLWNERISFRSTARGTPRRAFMFDTEIESPRLQRKNTDLRLYAKYENSPRMDFYGQGPDSEKSMRSSYRLEDFGLDLEGRQLIWNHLYLGATGGFYTANTGAGRRPGIPTTQELFDPDETPGLGAQGKFLRAGGLVQYDYRDNPGGPRSGANYYFKYTRYWDQDLGQHTFHQLEWAAEQYVPYWNQTRVLALRLATVMVYADPGQTVPFFLQASLGGNNSLRGFERYRFHDQSSILFTAEHRWYVFSGMHAAAFFEAGKVGPKASQMNFHELEYSGGIGLRFTVRDTVVMRLDNAVSREGYRFMWTFSNAW